MNENVKDFNRARRMLWLFGLFKIPLIGFVRPRLLELTDARMVVRIPLRRRTRNHLGSMYFGALAIGADLAGAFQSFYISKNMGGKLSIVFKNFDAQFLRRPESDVFFISSEGDKIREMINETVETGDRVTRNIHIQGVINYNEEAEVVAEFTLGLSVKHKGK